MLYPCSPPISYPFISNSTITFMKHLLLLSLFYLLAGRPIWAQHALSGKVTDSQGSPIPGVNILEKGTAKGTVTDMDGNYHITPSSPETTLIFSFIGFQTVEIPAAEHSILNVTLQEDLRQLSAVEVYATGYQDISAERATGSFDQIDNNLLSRSVSTDIISRLEGVSNGILFDTQSNTTPNAAPPRLRVRGLSTLYGEDLSGAASTKEAPLIVVDNFPYAGSIYDLNPNDVQSITILKDAAAASIWGAQAGNGVIVITTKKGAKNQPMHISINSNITFTERPDLNYAPDFLSATDYIGVEQTLFEQGYFSADEANANKPALSPVVELLIQERDGTISSEDFNTRINALKAQDIRQQAKKYLYQPGIIQQYALNLRGGTDAYAYYLSGGFDSNRSSVIGDQTDRITFTSQNTYTPAPNWQLSAGLYLIHTANQNNGLDFRQLQSYSRLPYLSLVDQNGAPASIPYGYSSEYISSAQENGLLDWSYYPLQERNLSDNETKLDENRLNLGTSYTFFKGLDLDLKYQYQYSAGERNVLQDKESWQVRNMVNRFTQSDGTRIYPYAETLTTYNTASQNHMARAQVNYSTQLGSKHAINALVGAEARQLHVQQHSATYMGYDSEILTYQSQFDYQTRYPTNPRGSARLPSPSYYLEDHLDRFISYFTNAAYTYDDRYTWSGSARWDASNLFGVNSNQKGVPLWSTGASWTISKESALAALPVSLLRLRTTYGFAGNIDKSATAYPAVSYFVDGLTDLPYGRLMSPGNPDLRWEKIGTFNGGLDFATRHNHLSGSLEYFIKNSTDLMAPVELDPTTGFLDKYNINNASLKTQGWDATINTAFNFGPIRWNTYWLVNYQKNEVTSFNYQTENSFSWYVLSGATIPVVGEPLYNLYSLPWYGLDPTTGDPLVLVDEQLSTDYSAYFQQLDPTTDLINNGPQSPPFFGSFRSSLTFKGFTIGATVSWKSGYYFRRSALSYGALFDDARGHKEFENRWQAPGDQNTTQVPSMPQVVSQNRDMAYVLSEITVEKGDHIRLQDVNISYLMQQSSWKALPVQSIKLYLYARNLGILWRANNKGLDPDYPLSSYPASRSLAMGIQIDF